MAATVIEMRKGRVPGQLVRAEFGVRFRASFADHAFRAEEQSIARLEGRYVRWRADALPLPYPHCALQDQRDRGAARNASGAGTQGLAPFPTGARMNRHQWPIAFLAAAVSTAAFATDRDDYNRRSAERFQAMFALADVNQDRIVTREETTGTIELVARFDDMDVNRDGSISTSELERFIATSFR